MSMIENDRQRVASIIGGFIRKDRTGTGAQPTREPGIHGIDVLGTNLPHNPRTTRPNAIDHSGLPSHTVILDKLNAGPGSTLSVISGYLADAPKIGNSPMSTNDIFMQNFTGATTQDDVTQPLDRGNIPGFETPKPVNNNGVPAKSTLRQNPLIPIEVANHGHHIGQSADDRNVYWEQKKDIATAESPFGSVPSAGMLRGLPGSILSLASTFSGLSKTQKQKIKSNTSPEMYNIIESNLLSASDVGSSQTLSLTSRVDQETFANNMVDLLSQCSSYSDLMECMHELRSNTQLHGKDKLPTVEYRIKNTFGDTGLIIDGYGEYKQNVSAEVANAQLAFAQFISQGVDNVEIISKFEGQIVANTLTVIHVDFGSIVKGDTYFVEGPDITNNTHIVRFETGTNGSIGTYYLNQPSNTFPNTEMILYKVTPNPEQSASSGGGGGGGGGLGGLVGMIPGQNMFGEASKLIGEIIPVMEPSAAARVKGLLSSLQGQTTKPSLDKITHQLPVFAGNAVKKGLGIASEAMPGIASKFAGRFGGFKLR